MTLEGYNRIKFTQNIRHLLIKDKCENCGATEKLELHHCTQFIELLYETLKELGLDYKDDISEYNDNELDKISNILLGKQLQIEYKTLCKECHCKVDRKFFKKSVTGFKRYQLNLKTLSILEEFQREFK